MHTTSVILVRNDMADVCVNKYVLRKTHDGQLVLDLIERKGSLHDLKHLNTEQAFLAITKKSYHGKKRKTVIKTGEALEEVAQTESVVVTIHDKDIGTYEPYQIIVFFNHVEIKKLDSNSEIEPDENELIMQVRGKRKKTFSFRRTLESSFPNLEKIFPERYEIYAEVKSVIWIDEDTYVKIGGSDIFDQEWANKMLEKLQHIDRRALIYPTLSGTWISKPVDKKLKVLPYEAYKEFAKGTATTRNFWEWFLQKIPEVEVEYSEESPEGKVIAIRDC